MPHFKLTAGNLARGRGMTARREGNGIRLTWKTGDVCRLEGADDVLHAGIMYDAERDGFDIARDVARRGDCTAFIPIDAPGGIVHVYPFFGKKNKTIFSENDYFTIEVEKIAPRRRAGKDKEEDGKAAAASSQPREEGGRDIAGAAERDDNEGNPVKKERNLDNGASDGSVVAVRVAGGTGTAPAKGGLFLISFYLSLSKPLAFDQSKSFLNLAFNWLKRESSMLAGK